MYYKYKTSASVARPYLPKLKKMASKRLRAKLRKRAESSSKPMVKRSISKSGKPQVSLPQVWMYDRMHCNCWSKSCIIFRSSRIGVIQIVFLHLECPNKTIDRLRSGSTGLKQSQVYPPGYGARMASLHKKYIVPGLVTNHSSWISTCRT